MRYAVLSDIHLAHNKTPTSHICSNLRKFLLTKDNSNLDAIFIAGDLFDQLLDLSSSDFYTIVSFCHELLEYCVINDIELRVLEGTPSHDWQQAKLLLRLNELRKKPCSLRYYPTLTIEEDNKLNKRILYIPDEWCHNHHELEKQIEAQLKEKALTNVDIAILHGQFGFQLKTNLKHLFHFDESYFLTLVKEYIHIGHYHTHRSFDRIIANGSFDRLAHNEEEDKGYVIVDKNNWHFIVNTNAYIYKTLSFNKTPQLDKLDKLIYQYPKGSYIRLLVKEDNELLFNAHLVKARYCDYHIKILPKEKTAEFSHVTHILHNEEMDFPLTHLEVNLYEELYRELHSRFTSNQLDYGLELIKPLEKAKIELKTID